MTKDDQVKHERRAHSNKIYKCEPGENCRPCRRRAGHNRGTTHSEQPHLKKAYTRSAMSYRHASHLLPTDALFHSIAQFVRCFARECDRQARAGWNSWASCLIVVVGRLHLPMRPNDWIPWANKCDILDVKVFVLPKIKSSCILRADVL